VNRIRDALVTARTLRTVVRRDGARRLAARALAGLADRVGRGDPPPMAVRMDHLLAPEAFPPDRWQPRRSGPYSITWIANPPGETSGGMSTLMHAIELLEGRGHDCRVAVLYKGARRDLDRDRAIARERFPSVAAPLDDLDAGIHPADALVATAWPTAYALRASGAAGVPFYLVQDYEPAFYAASSDSVLAAETYNFGFYGITAGRWLATTLERDHDMACTAFDLGVDLGCYTPPPPDARRDGVVFYARPDTPRRGFELGMAALALVAARHPEVPIHLVGQDLPRRDHGFAVVEHGRCPPGELASIYRRCVAGLVLSLTNLSLLPAELLATGCIPVMNDGENVRASFDNPFARFAPPRPDALADAICDVLEDPAVPTTDVAASVAALGWPLVADRLELALGRGMDRWRRAHGPDAGTGRRVANGEVDGVDGLDLRERDANRLGTRISGASRPSARSAATKRR